MSVSPLVFSKKKCQETSILLIWRSLPAAGFLFSSQDPGPSHLPLGLGVYFGLFLFTEVPKTSLSPAGRSSTLDAAVLLIWTSSLWLFIGE